MDIGSLQWPAMAVTVAASWLVASTSRRRRLIAFALYVLSNLLWAAWGLHVDALAVVALQVALFALNLRGIVKNED